MDSKYVLCISVHRPSGLLEEPNLLCNKIFKVSDLYLLGRKILTFDILLHTIKALQKLIGKNIIDYNFEIRDFLGIKILFCLIS